ncbi:MAG: antitoxin family protein [Planctomycetota bacterium]|nr:antitoxin family protein [Planctomycetota bacterium]
MGKLIHAIYENGVFKPTEKVDLPDKCEVAFEPRRVGKNSADDEANLDAIYEILSFRARSGEKDVAERHNEHQP